MNALKTLFALLLLTGLTAFLATFFSETTYTKPLILLLSGVKFLLVAFYFMELKKANIFWKAIVVGYLIVFIGFIAGGLF